MQQINKEVAQRVWQRVQGQEQPEKADTALLGLIAQEWGDAATFLMLSKTLQGKDSMLLKQMFEQEQAHVACLKGIYTLQTGQKPTVPQTRPVRESPALILRRCYGQKMHILAEFEARSAHPEYGPVFARMAQQEREQCMQILELLGRVNK